MRARLERARMLLGLWGDQGRRLRQLRRELAWAKKNIAVDDPLLAENGRALEEHIRQEMQEALRLGEAMQGLVEQLEPLEREVMHLRYREHRNYAAMAVQLGYSVDWLHHVKMRADEKIAQKLALPDP